jgi:exonuclease III
MKKMNIHICNLNIEHKFYENKLNFETIEGTNFLYINIRSLRNKLHKLESFLTQMNDLIHIIVLVEINLKEEEMKYYQLENYNCYHSCREGKSYGGVAMYIHTSIQSQLIVSEQFRFANFLTVELINLKYKIVGIYNPPETDKTDFIEYFDKFLDNKKKCFIFGDFNINLLDNNDNIVNHYTNTIQSNGFTLLNELTEAMHTRRSNTICTIIDHVFTDNLFIRAHFKKKKCSTEIVVSSVRPSVRPSPISQPL